ncbi:MAG: ribosomal RNA small subunit methyltransferase A [Gemmatimonadales bacterium]|nr:MAG: ribosomal RNA small subunit methyltransferase A [Gemmatimonadales bacterium]
MPRARLGQHFLSDPRILGRIVEALNPSEQDVVLEIGAGRGTLTAALAPRVGRVIAIEKDRRLASELKRMQASPDSLLGRKVSVVEGDALELDWHALAAELGGARSFAGRAGFKVVGNIPYYVTSPLIEKALSPPLPQVIVFLVQREVAERLRAAPGSKAYGALSAGVQVLARVEKLFAVKAGSFKPRPRVDSAVVRMVPIEEPLLDPVEHEDFRAFVTALFGQRRKQLAHSLRFITDASAERVERWLGSMGIDPRRRVETLSPAELLELFRQSAALTLEPESE